MYWFKYNNNDNIPDIFSNRIIVVPQESEPKDTTYICHNMINGVISSDNR